MGRPAQVSAQGAEPSDAERAKGGSLALAAGWQALCEQLAGRPAAEAAVAANALMLQSSGAFSRFPALSPAVSSSLGARGQALRQSAMPQLASPASGRSLSSLRAATAAMRRLRPPTGTDLSEAPAPAAVEAQLQRGQTGGNRSRAGDGGTLQSVAESGIAPAAAASEGSTDPDGSGTRRLLGMLLGRRDVRRGTSSAGLAAQRGAGTIGPGSHEPPPPARALSSRSVGSDSSSPGQSLLGVLLPRGSAPGKRVVRSSGGGGPRGVALGTLGRAGTSNVSQNTEQPWPLLVPELEDSGDGAIDWDRSAETGAGGVEPWVGTLRQGMVAAMAPALVEEGLQDRCAPTACELGTGACLR